MTSHWAIQRTVKVEMYRAGEVLLCESTLKHLWAPGPCFIRQGAANDYLIITNEPEIWRIINLRLMKNMVVQCQWRYSRGSHSWHVGILSPSSLRWSCVTPGTEERWNSPTSTTVLFACSTTNMQSTWTQSSLTLRKV